MYLKICPREMAARRICFTKRSALVSGAELIFHIPAYEIALKCPTSIGSGAVPIECPYIIDVQHYQKHGGPVERTFTRVQ